MQAENPEGWRVLTDDATLVQNNQAAIAACFTAAAQAKKEQRCTIVVPAP